MMSRRKEKPMLMIRVGSVLGMFHNALLNEYTDLKKTRGGWCAWQ